VADCFAFREAGFEGCVKEGSFDSGFVDLPRAHETTDGGGGPEGGAGWAG